MAIINGPQENADSRRNEQTNVREGLFKRDHGDNFTFPESEPRWDLEDIILCDDVKHEVRDAIDFCLHKKELIERFDLNNRFLKGRSSIGINLYGAPGTGKSITAEAIAKALNRKWIEVNYSSIQSEKWGGTERQLSSLFKQAEENNSIIFLDEADGLMGKRGSSGPNSETNNQIKSHLLTLIERSNVIVIYATNLFENMDKAFFRRILFHIYYPMPTKQELIKLWQLHIGSDNLPKKDDDFSYEQIANECEGTISGGDIKNLALKLCVKVGVGRISALTNDIVISEINKYKQNMKDRDGLTIGKENVQC